MTLTRFMCVLGSTCSSVFKCTFELDKDFLYSALSNGANSPSSRLMAANSSKSMPPDLSGSKRLNILAATFAPKSDSSPYPSRAAFLYKTARNRSLATFPGCFSLPSAVLPLANARSTRDLPLLEAISELVLVHPIHSVGVVV